MRAVPQLVSAPSNPRPTVGHFRWSHPRCEHSYRQEMLIRKKRNINVNRPKPTVCAALMMGT